MQRTEKRYFIAPIFITLIAFFALPSLILATWKKKATLPAPITACFFLNPSYGVAGSGTYGSSVPIAIYITTDGGTSWTSTATPPASGVVTQIAINPNGIGYASIYSLASTMNLLKTTDGGYSWTNISSGNHYGTGVGLNGQTAQWAVSGPAGNNTNGVFTMAGGNTIITPGPGGGGMGEAWGAYGDSVKQIWYMVTELSRQLYISTDLGLTWKLRFSFGPLMIAGSIPTGNIYGSGSSLYIQTDKMGLLRGSTNDTGASWIPIGGPSNVVDSRTLFTSGCSGQSIYAFDNAGVVWVSDDGGDGSLSNDNPLKIQHIRFTPISSCLTDTKIATITNHGCQPYVITNVTLINNASGVYSLLPPITLPDTLPSGTTDTFFVHFDPRFIPGAYNAQISVKGFFEAGFGKGVITADSNISISGLANAAPPKAQADPQQIDFGDVSICGGVRDSLFTIKNTGCDTLQIISGSAVIDPAFTINIFTSPYFLPPDSVFVIRVHFQPLIAGPAYSDPLFHITADGITKDITFHLEGYGVAGIGQRFGNWDEFTARDTISICSMIDSLDGYFVYIGCDSLFIQDIFQDGDSDFSISGLTSGMKTPSGDTIHFTLHFNPRLKGFRSGHLIVDFMDKSGKDTNDYIWVNFTKFVKDGTRILTTSAFNIDFGTTSLCEGKDTTITLSNTGCDTLRIADARVSGKGFVISGYSYPIIIPPDSSTTIRIFTVLDTVGGKTLMQDSLILLSNSDSSFSPINLTRKVQPIREVGMYLDATPQSGTTNTVANYNLKETPGKSFSGAGIRSLGFDLSYNTDLLEFIPAKSSAGLQSADGKHFILNSSASEIVADANGILASLAFEVFLTKDSTTTIGLENVALNGYDTIANPCGLPLSAGGSALFDYRYFCGEGDIARSMRGERILEISSITPNPARRETSVVIHSSEQSDVLIEILDVLGEKVFSTPLSLSPGANTIHLRINDLSSGSYILRAISHSGLASQKFTKIQ